MYKNEFHVFFLKSHVKNIFCNQECGNYTKFLFYDFALFLKLGNKNVMNATITILDTSVQREIHSYARESIRTLLLVFRTVRSRLLFRYD